MRGRLRLAIVLGSLLACLAAAAPVVTSQTVQLGGACTSLKVCRFLVSTDVPVTHFGALLALAPPAPSIYNDASANDFPPTNPLLCDSYVAGGNVGVNAGQSLVRVMGPNQVDASWFLQSALAAGQQQQMVLQVAFDGAATSIAGTIWAFSTSGLPYPTYVSCGLTNDTACPAPCLQTDVAQSCTVDALDLFVVLAAYGRPCGVGAITCFGQCATDFDNTGTTDATDLFTLLAQYGARCVTGRCAP